MVACGCVFEKDPDAVLDYSFDWEDWLCEGDTITASTWATPAGITEDSDSFTDDTTTVWLSGGTVGESYDLVNHVTTNEGREEDRTLTICIRQR